MPWNCYAVLPGRHLQHKNLCIAEIQNSSGSDQISNKALIRSQNVAKTNEVCHQAAYSDKMILLKTLMLFLRSTLYLSRFFANLLEMFFVI
jgi:hypothetical protein